MRTAEKLASRPNRKVIIAICAGLIGLAWFVYGQTLRFEFVNYDDNAYVYENPHILGGLSFRGIIWAFSHVHSYNWHPLTTISHMVDCQFYGTKAGAHHGTNVLLHSAATIALFLALRAMTGTLWRSAVVAILFAIHPLHVESVAWISERKDVLSGLFFMLVLASYTRYAGQPSIPKYLLVVALLALGLMCKPMLVTTPFVLLLVDYWPLRRFVQLSDARAILAEKIPLIVLSIASCAATLAAQTKVIGTTQQFPFSWRINNALISYAIYIWQMIWPARLAPFYPHSENGFPLWQEILAFVLLILLTFVAVHLRKSRPYFFTGWFWYLGMLVPVIGIVQVGLQAHADRYTYLPHIGLYLLVVWSLADIARELRINRYYFAAATAAVIAIFACLASIQTKYWHDGEKLWRRTLAITSDDVVPHYGLGDILIRHGQFTEAISEFRAALKLQPYSAYTQDHLAVALLKTGQTEEAISLLVTALQSMPHHPTAHYDLGNALFEKGNLDGAIQEYRQQLSQQNMSIPASFSQPDFVATHYDLGNCYARTGDFAAAVDEYQEALKLAPGSPLILNNLGFVLSQLNRNRDAVAQWEQALRVQKDNFEVMTNLAWILATSPEKPIQNPQRALDLAQSAEKLSSGNPNILRVLAVAYAQVGRFSEALDTAQHGLELATKQGDDALAENFREDLIRYRANKPIQE